MFVNSAGDRRSFLGSLRQTLTMPDVRQATLMMGLAAVILSGQIGNEVLYSVDGIVYSLVGKELTLKPISQWVVLTWNGLPFYEHPHLTPWLLGVSMSVFGATTLGAILPILLIALATVWLAYVLGRTLLDHRLGLLTGTVLLLTPEFIRGGRNPMLEPALMFFIMLAVYFHLAAARPGALLRSTILAGLSLGLALLAKGPPALLAPAVMVAFQAAARIYPAAFNGLMLPRRRLATHFAGLILIAAAVVMAVDLWHQRVAGSSFVAHYIGHQLRFTVVEARGAVGNDWMFYANTFVRNWPWWPFIPASVVLVAWKRDRAAVPAVVLGGLVTVGTFLGFTLMPHKAEWYTAIHYVGSSLMVAAALRYLLTERILERYYTPVTLGIIVPLLILSATVPSLFLQYGRPFERFMERARAELGDALQGQPIADCVSIEPWKGPFFLSFYLGVHRVDCTDATARLKLVDNRHYVTESGERLVFSHQPFSIIERATK
jgi:hypothetical protein